MLTITPSLFYHKHFHETFYILFSIYILTNKDKYLVDDSREVYRPQNPSSMIKFCRKPDFNVYHTDPSVCSFGQFTIHHNSSRDLGWFSQFLPKNLVPTEKGLERIIRRLRRKSLTERKIFLNFFLRQYPRKGENK